MAWAPFFKGNSTSTGGRCRLKGVVWVAAQFAEAWFACRLVQWVSVVVPYGNASYWFCSDLPLWLFCIASNASCRNFPALLFPQTFIFYYYFPYFSINGPKQLNCIPTTNMAIWFVHFNFLLLFYFSTTNMLCSRWNVSNQYNTCVLSLM